LVFVAESIVKRPATRTFLLIAIGTVLAILAARTYLVGKAVPTVAVKRETITETVISSGRVITPERIELGAELVGNVARRLVDEGDTVRAGQVLAELDASELRAATEQAASSLAEAEARLEQLRQVSRPVADQNLIQAEANLALANSEYERVRKLADSGFYSPARLDEASRARDAARAAREAALAQAKGNRPEGVETRLAEARRDQARASLALARAKLDNTVIRAPSAGVVVRKYIEPGDVVTQGKKLFELAAAGETQVVLQIDEKNLGRLALGQAAEVVADAYPGKPFRAEIFFIAAAVDPQKGSVEVKLRVPEPPAFIKPDMTVSAELRVGQKAGALILPSDAVRDAAGAQPWALVIADGRATRRPVKLGLRGTGKVQVLEGLSAGDAVIPASANVAEGKKVRPAG
jgi:HlyD family secretion protein